jgi:peptide chain release factor 1
MNQRLEKSDERFRELENLLIDPKIIADKAKYNKYAKELADLKDLVYLFRESKKIAHEIFGIEHVLLEKHDSDFLELARKELEDLKFKSTELENKIKSALIGEDKDSNKNVIFEIRQGTGGSEAALFAADLYRMYTKYAARKNWTVETMAAHTTDAGGFKEIVFSVKGKGAHKNLKFESGVHRVQRVPETEAQGRIHTSTATVAVLVEPEDVEFNIDAKDLRVDTYRASGPGGQHMQKCDSAVRITHVPTGVVAACQDERSQLKNKTKAMRILRARLLDIKAKEEFKKVTQERKSQVGSGDRSEKIRTYNFPDRRVTDHRINLSLYQLESVLDGGLEEFSAALIKASEEEKQKDQ